MAEVWTATVKSIRDNNYRRLREVEKSLDAIKNKTGWYAADHRRVIALRRAIATMVDEHIEASKLILPAPKSADEAEDAAR